MSHWWRHIRHVMASRNHIMMLLISTRVSRDDAIWWCHTYRCHVHRLCHVMTSHHFTSLLEQWRFTHRSLIKPMTGINQGKNPTTHVIILVSITPHSVITDPCNIHSSWQNCGDCASQFTTRSVGLQYASKLFLFADLFHKVSPHFL